MKREQPEAKTEINDEQALFEKISGIDFILGEFLCGICHKEMSKSVKILCAECGLQLCLECLASGKELQNHKKAHDYYILDRLKVSLYAKEWTALEELMLIRGKLFAYVTFRRN